MFFLNWLFGFFHAVHLIRLPFSISFLNFKNFYVLSKTRPLFDLIPWFLWETFFSQNWTLIRWRERSGLLFIWNLNWKAIFICKHVFLTLSVAQHLNFAFFTNRFLFVMVWWLVKLCAYFYFTWCWNGFSWRFLKSVWGLRRNSRFSEDSFHLWFVLSWRLGVICNNTIHSNALAFAIFGFSWRQRWVSR